MRAVILALVVLLPTHDDAGWIQERGLKNKAGEWCCGVSDCQIVEDVVEVRGGYRVRLRLQVPGTPTNAKFKDIDEFVPFEEIQPSPDGKFWRCRDADGERRCVFAGIPGA